MGSLNPTVQTRTSLSATGLSTLASATYCVSSAYNCATNDPLDVVIEVNGATTNTPAGNKQLIVFVKESLDGTNFRSGPESGTTTTDEPDLFMLGYVPMLSSSTTHTGFFSLVKLLGWIPSAFKIVVKNDLGVSLTAGTLYTAEIAGVTA